MIKYLIAQAISYLLLVQLPGSCCRWELPWYNSGLSGFRSFLQPHVSSFVKAEWPEEKLKYILSPSQTCLMAGGLAVLPSFTHLILCCYINNTSGTYLSSIVSASIFMLYECNIYDKNISNAYQNMINNRG